MPLSDVDTTLPRPKRSWMMMSPATTDSGADADLLPDTGLLPAKGLLPATGFLKDTGIRTARNGALLVDREMRTSLDHVWAAGDCAVVYHRIMEEDRPGATAARVRLTRAVRDVIRTGLWLIGVEAPERM